MKSPSMEERMREALELRKKNDSFRKTIPYNKDLHDFSSNDYLGLARSEDFASFAEKSCSSLSPTQKFGSGGSRLLSGDSDFIEETEVELAAYFRSEAALIFNSGYQANCGMFSCLPQKGDTILYDALIHASVRDGIRLSLAKSWSFRHNDVEHLHELILKAEGKIFIALESIYSMDGDRSPLAKIVELAEAFDASVILDEAHSTGLYGNGTGIAIEAGLESKIFARLYTFGKAMGCHGSFVAGSKTLRDYLINFSRPFIYTTSLPLHDIQIMRSAVQFVRAHPELHEQLFQNVHYFRKKSVLMKLPILRSESAIQGILIPGNNNVRKKMTFLRTHSFDTRAILSPTVASGSERLRIIIHSFNTRVEIDELIDRLTS